MAVVTLLPVPIADFRANLKKYADMLRGGNLEIVVTNHGRPFLRCLTPEDVPEVENPPGVDAELMNRLWSGEEEPVTGYTLTEIDQHGSEAPQKTASVVWNVGDEDRDGTFHPAAHISADPSSGPDFTATTVYHRDDAGRVTVVAVRRKRTPKPPPPPKEPKPPGPADLARLIGWPKSAFPVNFQKPRPGKGDDWTLWGKLGHKRVWPGLGKLGRAEALGWCIKAVEGSER